MPRPILTAILLTLALALAALWLVGRWRAPVFTHTAVITATDPAVPDGTMGAWTSRIIYTSASTNQHSLYLSRSEFLSVAAKREELAKSRYDRWTFNFLPRLMMRNPVEPTFFNSLTDWRADWAAAGIYPYAGGASIGRAIEIPFWLLLLLALLPGVHFLRRILTLRARARRGQCLACGYPTPPDATPCPECGRA